MTRMTLRQRLVLEWLGVALLAALAVAALVQTRALERFDNVLYDWLAGIDPPAMRDDILIVAIDEQSLTQLGSWPWPRRRHAALLAALARYQPKGVAFDILLTEPSEDDAMLAAAMAQVRPLVVPMQFIVPGLNGADYDRIDPVPALKAAASATGHVNLEFSSSGAVRQLALCAGGRDSATREPHLMATLMQSVTGAVPPVLARMRDCRAPLIIPYAAKGSVSSIGYADLIAGRVPASVVRGRYVLVGATALGLRDSYPVPGSDGTMAGVEIMANVLSALHADNFVQPLADWQTIGLSLLAAGLMLVGFWVWKPRTALLMGMVLLAALLALSIGLLQIGYWFAPSAALLGIVLVYPLWGWRRLQATSDFLDAQLGRLQEGQAAIPVVERSLVPVDHVTGQAEALGQAITHNRDLRRFIADALANLPDPMFLTGLDNRVKLANKLSQIGAGDGVVDLPLGAMLDRFVADSDREAVQQYLNQQVRGQPADFVDFQSRDGRVFAMRRVPVLSDQNDLRGHIHYLADITALAKASSEREQVIELLSHDMRAPQAAILALLDGQMTPAVRDQIANNARRTLTMADNFVDLARMNANEFEGEPLLISALLTEAADSFWPIAHQRGVTIALDDWSDCAFVIGEGGTLYRAFCNVIDNAIKYSPDGGTVRIGLRRTAIDESDWLSIAIADTGKGIAPAILPRLFERFASSGDRGAAGVKGTGLGLNFVAAVLARHGGSIRADNAERGTGACFTMLLPLADDDFGEDDGSDDGAAVDRSAG